MFVVVADVGWEGSFEVPSVDDQDPVETFAADGADPSFDEGVRAGCPYWCADCSNALGAEHLIERRGELAVAIVGANAVRNTRSECRQLGRVTCRRSTASS